MEILLYKLIKILEKELQEGENLLKILEEKKEIMKNADLKELNEKIEKEKNIVDKILDLEDERRKTVIEIAEKLNITPENLTISKLIEFTTLYKEKLNELKNKIVVVFNKITNLSEINKYLIERSLLFIEDRIKVIKHTMAIKQGNICDKKI